MRWKRRRGGTAMVGWLTVVASVGLVVAGGCAAPPPVPTPTPVPATVFAPPTPPALPASPSPAAPGPVATRVAIVLPGAGPSPSPSARPAGAANPAVRPASAPNPSPGAVRSPSPAPSPTPGPLAGAIVYAQAGSIVVQGAAGGEARTLVQGSDLSRPRWSPDGRSVLFMGGVGQAAELYVVPAAGGTARRLTSNARPERGATWSPRGDHVAYSLPGGLAQSHVPAPTEPEEIWAIDIRTGAQRKLADGFDPAWAPDGSRLAYATNGRRTDDGATDNAIHLVQADGSGERPVLSVSALPLDLQPAHSHPFRPGTVRLRAPAWAPDGQHLVASADGHTGMAVTVDERGQNLRPLALAYEGGVGRARWAPHGGRLLIESRPATGVDVALVVDAVSGSERRIGGIQEGFSTRAVTWAPDSSRLAVVAGPPTERPGSDPDPVELRLYAADGSPIRTMASGNIADPDWGSAEP